MKSFSLGAQNGHLLVSLVMLVLMAEYSCFGLRPHQFSYRYEDLGTKRDHASYTNPNEEIARSSKSDDRHREELGMDMYPTGSSLPDCSHACGPCFPCKRVMVSFKCSVESCPVVYRCTCRGKYYHVPSN